MNLEEFYCDLGRLCEKHDLKQMLVVYRERLSPNSISLGLSKGELDGICMKFLSEKVNVFLTEIAPEMTRLIDEEYAKLHPEVVN